tara:strand:+ start:114 stop:269 length:156 start_codon:yes stop_codon:yes gene_type:complete
LKRLKPIPVWELLTRQEQKMIATVALLLLFGWGVKTYIKPPMDNPAPAMND